MERKLDELSFSLRDANEVIRRATVAEWQKGAPAGGLEIQK
jgi:hypothetical protein